MNCVLATSHHMQGTLAGDDVKVPAVLFRLLTEARTLDINLDAQCQDAAHDILVLGALLGRLRQLSEHTAEMALRIVALVQKQRKVGYSSGAGDLYDFQIEV